MSQCNHECGWCSKDQTFVFITRSGDIQLNFGNKLLLICNNPTCKAKRYLYFNRKTNKNRLGRILYRKEGKK